LLCQQGLIQPDETTFEYLKGRPMVPGVDDPDWNAACEYWKSLQTDEGAHFDIEVHIDAADIAPTVTWGTSPQDTAPITGTVSLPATFNIGLWHHHFLLWLRLTGSGPDG
jgi:3-isopropylmalate dehydratase